MRATVAALIARKRVGALGCTACRLSYMISRHYIYLRPAIVYRRAGFFCTDGLPKIECMLNQEICRYSHIELIEQLFILHNMALAWCAEIIIVIIRVYEQLFYNTIFHQQ